MPEEEEVHETEVENSKEIEFSVNIDSFHSQIKEDMEHAGIDVESFLSEKLMPDVERELYNLYQESKYSSE